MESGRKTYIFHVLLEEDKDFFKIPFVGRASFTWRVKETTAAEETLLCFAWRRKWGGINVKNDAEICHIFHHFQALLKGGCLLNVLPFFFLFNVPALLSLGDTINHQNSVSAQYGH